MTMPTRRFDNDDQAAQHWLTMLRDGDADQKILAREQLAVIFERRGMPAEAAELREANAQAAAAAPAPPAPHRRQRRSTLRMVGLGCLGCGGLAVLGLVALVAIGSQLPKPATTPTMVAIQSTVAPTMAPTAPPAATAAPTPPPEPTAPPAAAPAKPERPTPTPRPSPLAVMFTGRFEPTTLRVGQKLVVELTLENKSERQIEGLRIFSSGPWDKYTIVNVMPGGRHESGLLGHNFYTGMVFPPGVKRTVNIVAYPNEPGNHEFSFIPHRETEALKDEKGQGIVIGGKVNVVR